MTDDSRSTDVGPSEVFSGFDALVGSCDFAVAIVDPHGRVLRGNEQLAALVHRTVEEMEGAALAAVLGKDSGWDGSLEPGGVHPIERGARRLELSVRPSLRNLLIVWIVDVTALHLAAWRMSLVAAMSEGIARSETLDIAIDEVMAHVCAATGWDLAQVWLPEGSESDSNTMVLHRSWCSTVEDASEFRDYSQELRLGRGEDIVGQVWESEAPVFIGDLSSMDNVARASPAVEAGFCSAAAFPVRSDRGIEAIIEFFTTRPRPDDEALLAIAASVTAQLERLIACQRIEEQVCHTTTAFEAAVNGAMTGMAMIDREGRLVRVNHAFETITGVSESELVGHHLTEFVRPDDAGPWTGRLDQILNGETTQFQTEVRYIRPDHSVADALVVGSTVTGEGVQPIQCVVQVLDITARRQAEDRARTLSVSLQEHITALAAARRELQHLVGRLVESEEEERGRLAIGLHDEVLPLLTSARLSAEQAVTSTSGDLSENLSDTIRSLDAVAARLRDTAFHLRPRALDTEGLFAAVLEMTAGLTLNDGGPEIQIQFEGSDAAISPTARVLAYRTVQEATRNAFLHAQARSVRISLSADEVEVCGEVSDDGIGIDPDSYGQRVTVGHIGVASMRETILIAQGSFELLSMPGEGTTVRFSLPSTRVDP